MLFQITYSVKSRRSLFENFCASFKDKHERILSTEEGTSPNRSVNNAVCILTFFNSCWSPDPDQQDWWVAFESWWSDEVILLDCADDQKIQLLLFVLIQSYQYNWCESHISVSLHVFFNWPVQQRHYGYFSFPGRKFKISIFILFHSFDVTMTRSIVLFDDFSDLDGVEHEKERIKHWLLRNSIHDMTRLSSLISVVDILSSTGEIRWNPII